MKHLKKFNEGTYQAHSTIPDANSKAFDKLQAGVKKYGEDSKFMKEYKALCQQAKYDELDSFFAKWGIQATNEGWFPNAKKTDDTEYEVSLLDGDVKLFTYFDLVQAFHEYSDEESFLSFISDGKIDMISDEDGKWLVMFYNDNPSWVDEYDKQHDESTNEGSEEKTEKKLSEKEEFERKKKRIERSQKEDPDGMYPRDDERYDDKDNRVSETMKHLKKFNEKTFYTVKYDEQELDIDNLKNGEWSIADQLNPKIDQLDNFLNDLKHRVNAKGSKVYKEEADKVEQMCKTLNTEDLTIQNIITIAEEPSENMKHLNGFNEEMSNSTTKKAEKLYSIFVNWLGTKDFEFYDGQEDFHNKFIEVATSDEFKGQMDDMAPLVLANYLEDKWGLYDGYDDVYNKLQTLFENRVNEGMLDPESPESIEVEGWLTFMDGQDGSYSIALHGTKQEAADRIGTDEPESTYEDGALEPIKFKIIQKDGKWIIDPKGARVSIDG